MKRFKVLFIAVWAVVLIITESVPALAQKVLYLDGSDRIIDVTPYVGFFTDTTHQITLQKIRTPEIQKHFKLNKQNKVNYGSNGGTVWFKLVLQGNPGQYVLELTNTSLQDLKFYTPIPNGHYHEAKRGTYNERAIKATSLLFKISLLDSEPHVFYMRCHSQKVLMAPLYIGTAVAFIEKNHTKDLMHGMYFGLMIIMILYNLFIYISTRELAYLYYVCYVFSLTLLTATMAGHSQEFLWPNYPTLDEYNFLLLVLIGYFSILFANRFLHTKRYAPHLRTISYWLHPCFTVVAVISFFDLNIAIKLGQVFILLTSLLLIAMGVKVALKKYAPARLYLLGWGSIFVTSSVASLSYANLLPINIDNIFFIEMGATGEVLLFSLALANRLNFYRKEQERTQQENERLVKEQNEHLEKEVERRTSEIEHQKEEIIAQAQVLEESIQHLHLAHNNIKSSIQYAKRIQLALLPPQTVLTKQGLNFFILYKPRDIVSGDFYWFTEVEKAGRKQLIIAVADCTGHGVPGAFMTIMGNDLLNQLVKGQGMTDPAKILAALDHGVMNALGIESYPTKGHKKNQIQDGMDMALCLIDFEAGKIIFAGAKRPLYYFHKHQMQVIKGSKYPIGSTQYAQKSFEKHHLTFAKGDALYMLSDGYVDQFGGENNAKFMVKKFKHLLKEIEHLPMPAQKEFLERSLEDWKGFGKQTDDILVLGLRL
ncbi:7TM diverse intracellular signaling domain-containing protein [uncultured Microscilla sp.]|uniref:7TM diverse intracellular signaling domain-containing protein n=1 Tax=uncultured Microscilla sp. TaxID=432653 RepID=UPI002613BBD2|nr:7TM diverse intracellular signaling domain-containing protein [uncultured Microscilla sp.]